MLMENDMILAFYKKEDHLKPVAERLFSKIEHGDMGLVVVPSVFSIELYYVLRYLTGATSVRNIISHLLAFPNVSIVPSTVGHHLGALFLMENYKLTSVFDALYAATAMSKENPDHAIVSSDRVYDGIEGLTRLDPSGV